LDKDSQNFNCRLYNNKINIVLLYIFAAINCIIGDDMTLGILFAIVGILCLFDHRKEMNGKLAVFSCYIVHFASSVLLLYIYSMWWLLLYPIELLIISSMKQAILLKKRSKG